MAATEPLISTALFGALSRPWHLAYCAAGIIVLNLAWGVVQERVGATDYCDAAGARCERFRGGIPVMGLMQAAAASLVGFAAMRLFGTGEEAGAAGAAAGGGKGSGGKGSGGGGGGGGLAGASFVDFFQASLCHTIASPVGYFAMSFIPFPLYMLVSSCKLIPVMAVGMLVNGARRPASDYLSAAIMTQGVLLYSAHQITGGGGGADKGHGEKGHAHAGAPVSSLFGVELDDATRLIVGVVFTLVNLSLEGYTNASQDRLFKAGAARGRPVPGMVMMACMNAWTVVLLTCGLLAQLGLAMARGLDAAHLEGASFLYSAGAFAARHPEVVLHVSCFSLLGALAQLFIFTCIGTHGSFTSTVITISRKFVTVLISVALFGHKLDFVQWLGVLDVFAGLGVQMAFGGGGHGGGHGAAVVHASAAPPAALALAPSPPAKSAAAAAAAAAESLVATPKAAAAAAAADVDSERVRVSPRVVVEGSDGAGAPATAGELRKRKV
jgi:UDP-galactose transporter B1